MGILGGDVICLSEGGSGAFGGGTRRSGTWSLGKIGSVEGRTNDFR